MTGVLAPIALLLTVLPAGGAMAQHEDHQPASPTTGHEDQPMAEGEHGGHEMMGLFGPYPMSRESSGTSWQPESTPMFGYHFMKGPWMLMIHATADAVYD